MRRARFNSQPPVQFAEASNAQPNASLPRSILSTRRRQPGKEAHFLPNPKITANNNNNNSVCYNFNQQPAFDDQFACAMSQACQQQFADDSTPSLANSQFIAALSGLSRQLAVSSPTTSPATAQPASLVMHEFENPYVAQHEQQSQLLAATGSSISSTSNTTNNSAVSGYSTATAVTPNNSPNLTDLAQFEQLIISGKQYSIAHSRSNNNNHNSSNSAKLSANKSNVCSIHKQLKLDE